MKINAEKFKSMVSKAMKAVSNNKMIPITQLMNISVSDNKLTLITTDATNYLYVIDDIEADDFNVTVSADIFGKLVSKMTSDNITLTLDNNTLEVTGNGAYTIELPLDENGNIIEYPNPYAAIKESDYTESQLSLSMIKLIHDTVKPSLATSLELPVITNYYIGDKVIATDRYKIASIDSQLVDSPIVVSSDYLDLLDVITTDSIKTLINKDSIICIADNIIVFGKFTYSADAYPCDSINDLLDTDIDNVCHVNKIELLNLLDRMSLFTNDITSRSTPITLDFNDNGITISNKSGKSNETVLYIDNKDHKSFRCAVNIELLVSQVKAYAGDSIEIHYGHDNLIKFVDGSITQIIALYSEE